MMVRYVATKEVTIQALGADHKNETLDEVAGRQHFNKVFQYIKDKEASRKQMPEYTRIIGNEVVGKQLTPSTPLQRLAIDPAELCQHPKSQMKRRGNAKEQKDGSKNFSLWWTCLLCNSRWERYAVPAPQTEGTPADSDIILFGKHAGLTFLEVYNKYPSYCNWVLETQEMGESPSQHLLYFAKYLLFHAPADPPESIRIKQEEAKEQAFGPLNPQNYPQRPSTTGQYNLDPTQFHTLGATPQQLADARAFAGTEWTHVTQQQQGQAQMEWTAEEIHSMQMAELEHRRAAHTGMIDDDKDL